VLRSYFVQDGGDNVVKEKMKWWELFVLLVGPAAALGFLIEFLIGWRVIGAAMQGQHAPEWVQAIGSLVGLGIAIGVPWRLHVTERLRRLADDHARAKVVAVGTLADLESILDLASSAAIGIEKEIANSGPKVNLQLMYKGFTALNLPNDDHVMQIRTVDPVAALAMRRGITRFRHLSEMIRLYSTEPESHRLRAAIHQLHRHFDPAVTDLVHAHHRLRDFLGVIPEFPVPALALEPAATEPRADEVAQPHR
jgi:hypothetical protein